jgi:hypothetical protein
MARKRMIDPAIWEDPTVGSLSIPARLLFIGLISHADDEGRLDVEPRYLRRAVFGFDDDVSCVDVSRYLDEIAQLRGVVFYSVDERRLASLTNWRRYQYIQKAQTSRLPAPPSENVPLSVTDDDGSSNVPVPYDDDTDNKTLSAARNGRPASRETTLDDTALQAPKTSLSSQYVTGNVALSIQSQPAINPVSNNRIEVNRIEQNTTTREHAHAREPVLRLLPGGGGGVAVAHGDDDDEQVDEQQVEHDLDSQAIEADAVECRADWVDGLKRAGLREREARLTVDAGTVASDDDMRVVVQAIETSRASGAHNPGAVVWSQYLKDRELPPDERRRSTSTTSTVDASVLRARDLLQAQIDAERGTLDTRAADALAARAAMARNPLRMMPAVEVERVAPAGFWRT